MPTNVTPLREKPQRFVDPRTSPADQFEQLGMLIKEPPENSRIVTFSPGLCQIILEKINLGAGKGNRAMRPSNIKRFAQAMKDGVWNLTGDTIKFSSGGHLLDGQNRLAGSVMSKKPFRSHVVFGVKADAFAFIDAGAGRTNPDTLHTYGVANSSVVAPAVRWLILLGDAPRGQQPERGRKIDNKELLDHYVSEVEHDQIQAAAKDAMAICRASGRLFPSGNLAACLYLFDKKSRTARIKFAEDLLRKRAGGKVLMSKIQRIKENNMGRVHEAQLIALIIQAWNAHRAGQKLTRSMLKWDEASDFPVIA